MDLTGVARSFETYKPYITAGLTYLAMCLNDAKDLPSGRT